MDGFNTNRKRSPKRIRKELLITVAAFDGTTLAVDSRMTQGGAIISDNFVKVIELNHPELGRLIGAVAGAPAFIGPWREYVEENGFGPVPVLGHDDDYMLTGLFLDEDGDCWQASTDGTYFCTGKEPMAIGSGSMVARYLLKKGKNSLSAVREACKEDLFCGGVIRVYNPKTKKLTEYQPD